MVYPVAPSEGRNPQHVNKALGDLAPACLRPVPCAPSVLPFLFLKHAVMLQTCSVNTSYFLCQMTLPGFPQHHGPCICQANFYHPSHHGSNFTIPWKSNFFPQTGTGLPLISWLVLLLLFVPIAIRLLFMSLSLSSEMQTYGHKIFFSCFLLWPLCPVWNRMWLNCWISLEWPEKKKYFYWGSKEATLRRWHLIFILKGDWDLNKTRGGSMWEVFPGSKNHMKILVMEKHNVYNWWIA